MQSTTPAASRQQADLSGACAALVPLLQILCAVPRDSAIAGHLDQAETHLLAAAVAIKRAEQGIPWRAVL